MVMVWWVSWWQCGWPALTLLTSAASHVLLTEGIAKLGQRQRSGGVAILLHMLLTLHIWNTFHLSLSSLQCGTTLHNFV